MTNIKIYYGPKHGFTEYYKAEIDDNYQTLSTLVRQVDDINKQQVLLVQGSEHDKPEKEIIELENLVVNSGEYASVNEHVILNFDGFLSNIVVKNIYLHNPPELLEEKLVKTFPNSSKKLYQYKGLNYDILQDIYNKFDNEIIDQNKVKIDLVNSLVPHVFSDEKRPKIIMFYGPSGVGKTETAKFIAKILGGDLFRKQLSMFQNYEFLSYLFGGHLYEKSFAKDLLERETNVILLDEFDKTSPVFHSAFYQLFDEGLFIDKNYFVDIGDPIVICTSNYENEKEIRNKLGDPIFSRFDSFIKFSYLSESGIRRAINLFVQQEYNSLNDEGKSAVDISKIEKLFEPYISKIKNVRRIKHMVRNTISNEIRVNLIEKKDN